MENKVLTPEECMALSDGTMVFLEMKGKSNKELNGMAKKKGDQLVDNIWPLTIGGKGHMAGTFRVWDGRPSDQKMVRTPWSKTGD